MSVIHLQAKDLPRKWYNLAADLPTPPYPPLTPDGKPVTAEMLAPVFPMNLIEQEIQTGQVTPLAALKRGRLEIVDIEISENSPVLGKPIMELKLPAEAIIVCIVRQDRAMIPRGDMRFEVGDGVIALVRSELEHEIRGIFAEDMA